MLDIAGSGMGGPVPLGPFVKRQGR
jgi:hypothetical protein